MHIFKNNDETSSIIITLDSPQVSITLELPPNKESESDLDTFNDPYQSNFK